MGCNIRLRCRIIETADYCADTTAVIKKKLLACIICALIASFQKGNILRMLSLLIMLFFSLFLHADPARPASMYTNDGAILRGSKLQNPSVIKDEKILVHGDLRYRYQHIDRDSRDDDGVHRLRMRFGADARVNDTTFVEVQFATGSSDPVSTNDSLGDGFTSKQINIDIADFFWTFDGKQGWLRGGKFKDPYKSAHKNQMIWDDDLRPEGFDLSYTLAASETQLLAGIWYASSEGSDTAVKEATGTHRAVYFYNLQLVQPIPVTEQFKLIAALAYYDCGNLADNTIPEIDGKVVPKGNSVTVVGQDDTGEDVQTYQYDYRILNAFIEAHLERFSLSYEFAYNTAIAHENFAYNIGAFYASKEWMKFKIGYYWRDTQKDAVVGAFNDSDFMGGGTDSRGHQVMAGVTLDKNIQLAMTYIDGEIKNSGSDKAPEAYRRLHADLLFKF